eukprot:3797001-Alexandrium_andersonii.AAC.1
MHQPVSNRPRAAVDADALRPQSHVLPVQRLMRRRVLLAYRSKSTKTRWRANVAHASAAAAVRC